MEANRIRFFKEQRYGIITFGTPYSLEREFRRILILNKLQFNDKRLAMVLNFHNKIRVCLLLFLLGSLGLLTGCGPKNPWGDVYPVEGTVTFDGNPASRLEVTFTPEQGRPSVGGTDDNGKFKMEYTIRQSGVQAGKSRVMLSIPMGSQGQNDAAKKVVEVMKSRKEPYHVEITKKEKDLRLDFTSADLKN